MDPGYSRAHSPSNIPASSSKFHHPYFTPAEVEYLSEKQRGKLSVTQEDKVRQNACGFLEALGVRIGFPRRTIGTAQNLYHRFHLYFPRKDFNYVDVCLAALYVSTKMHDTLKKPRELLAVSYAIRYPDLAAKSKHPGGEVDLDSMDPQSVEHDRHRLLAVERLILETICFNFTTRMPFPYLIKIARAINASKKLTRLSWRLAIDCYRTLLPLQYPPNTIAMGGIYVAALLASFEQPPEQPEQGCCPAFQIAETLGTHGSWERKFQVQAEDLEDIAHTVLDLLIQFVQNPSANTSPSTPSSPSPHQNPRHHQPQPPPPPPYKADQLIRLKIAMRQTEFPPRSRPPLGNTDPSSSYNKDGTHIGRNEGTVRFLFGPPNLMGNGV